MVVFASTVDNGVNMVSNAASAIMDKATIIADTFGISSIVVLLIGLYLGIKVGKKVVSAILIVVAVACACMFFFGKEPIQELLMRIEGLVA